jgi:hypothetical protein
LRGREKPNDIVRGAIAIVAGIALIFVGDVWLGAFGVLFGLYFMVTGWLYRDVPPIDAELLADVDGAMELEKSDPAAADKLIDQALSNADQREERELADLRRRAGSDPQAAIELRNWLRGKLKICESARRKGEKAALNRPGDDALLKEMDRQASDIEKELAQVEQNVERFRTE